ncbi:hypothetical protein JTE90_013854, partial [Oedothorax gibbosus]
LFTTTNNLPDCQSSEAFRDRVVAIPFLSRFVDKPPRTTSEQVRLCRYGKDEYVIEHSYVGCFLTLSYHLKKYMNIKDGLLHYRDTPPSVVEFTEVYLYNTDVYNQFKTNMDVQMYDDGMTTMTDLRSAVRQFLKNTKNNTTTEPQLILRFEEEFKECRKVDDPLGCAGHSSILDSDEPTSSEPSSKRLKIPDTVIYYENVVILLKTQKHALDHQVSTVVIPNQFTLRTFKNQKQIENVVDVTHDLVRRFKGDARAFIRNVLQRQDELGYLYNVVENRHVLDHKLYIPYRDFPFKYGHRVISEVMEIAKEFFPEDTEKFCATMLYLLIFYCLLVNNDHMNWVTVEYLSNCNRFHGYAIHINWKKRVN